ncbi:hypothetical protein Tco_0728077 [Tanacetum coccineum]|uniref:Uncharacterized protein n=1 Tax=Tanacetum coccineum TaxID=301880 RepID=A0ABQ4YMG9_9ASTR
MERVQRGSPLAPENLQWKTWYDPEHLGISSRLGGESRKFSLFQFSSRVRLYYEDRSRENSTRSSLRRAVIVKVEHLLMEFWPTIRDEEFVGVICNVPYWLARCLKGIRDRDLICDGMFVTKLARSFGILTRELMDALSFKPRTHIFKKKSLITIGIIVELNRGECYWPVTRQVGEDDEVEEAAEKGAGGSSEVYRNMSRGD